jgi:hypothetical protein
MSSPREKPPNAAAREWKGLPPGITGVTRLHAGHKDPTYPAHRGFRARRQC